MSNVLKIMHHHAFVFWNYALWTELCDFASAHSSGSPAFCLYEIFVGSNLRNEGKCCLFMSWSKLISLICTRISNQPIKTSIWQHNKKPIKIHVMSQPCFNTYSHLLNTHIDQWESTYYPNSFIKMWYVWYRNKFMHKIEFAP